MTLEKVTRSFVFFVQLLELKAREKKRTKKKERSGRETQKNLPLPLEYMARPTKGTTTCHKLQAIHTHTHTHTHTHARV